MTWLDRFLFRDKKPAPVHPVAESKEDAVIEVSPRSSIEAAVPDTARSAADIKGKAIKAARTEAARIITQAKRDGQAIKEKAEKTAADIELEAKKRAFQFLVQETQAIAEEIAQEYRLALTRLSANLQALSNESQQIDTELKRKMAMLAANRTWALKEAKTALLGTAKPSAPAVEVAAPMALTEETPAAETATIAATAISSPVPPAEKDRRKFFSFSLRVPFRKQKSPPAETKEAGVIEQPAAPAPTPEEPPAAPPEAIASVAEKDALPAESFAKPADVAESPSLLAVDPKTLYSGEVELVIVPPVDLKLVTQLYNYLQTVTDLKVLYTRGSWDQGTTIVVTLEKPFTLIKTITGTPNIIAAVGVLEKDIAVTRGINSLLRRKDRNIQRLGLSLKEAEAANKA